MNNPRKRPPEPKHDLIVDAWKHETDLIIDPGEPACFRCGYWSGTGGPWSKAGLERAHLFGHGDGGNNEPENYALICGPCHADQPDDSKERALAYIKEPDNITKLIGYGAALLQQMRPPRQYVWYMSRREAAYYAQLKAAWLYLVASETPIPVFAALDAYHQALNGRCHCCEGRNEQ